MLESRKQVEQQAGIVSTIVLATISVLGILGNCVVIAVYRNKARKITEKLIVGLACVDLVVCLIDIPMTIILDVWGVATVDAGCRIFGAFKGFIILLSPEVLVLIAMERFAHIFYHVPGRNFRLIYNITQLLMLLINVCSSVLMTLFTGTQKLNIDLRSRFMQKMMHVLWSPQTLRNYTHTHELRYERRISSSCTLDSSYLPRWAYHYYHVVICGILLLIMAMLIFFYSSILGFVRRQHIKMCHKYGAFYKESNQDIKFSLGSPEIKLHALVKTSSQPDIKKTIIFEGIKSTMDDMGFRLGLPFPFLMT
ncbi:hypothetical protein Ciccas_008908 [Cichlidogyrus casuarinus]|uniref:G-protein coupled receptors family 1 profile domain-containing protein n=1 Tax=Cichlidogyrus casuarinus TaxID=1844966 RepID=A0ABD2PYJ8_9PLAT